MRDESDDTIAKGENVCVANVMRSDVMNSSANGRRHNRKGAWASACAFHVGLKVEYVR